MREPYGDIMRLMLTTAPHHTEIAEALRVATKRYRDAIEAVAVGLHGVGGLRAGKTVAGATTSWHASTKGSCAPVVNLR
ncbi:hypothetical protein [Micromonospora aurantiaca (nom. illeg.)]